MSERRKRRVRRGLWLAAIAMAIAAPASGATTTAITSTTASGSPTRAALHAAASAAVSSTGKAAGAATAAQPAAVTTTTHPITAAATTTHAITATATTTATTATATTTATTATTSSPAATSAPPSGSGPARTARVLLSGWLADATRFPSRALVLSAPSQGGLRPSGLHITENGAPVRPFTLTPITRAGRGDFGLVVAVDRNSSMAGPGLASAMAGVGALIARRTAAQQLGLITFSATPRLVAPLSADQSRLGALLKTTPATGPGADVPAAVTLALSALARSRSALGALIVISDGVGTGAPGASPSSATLKAAAGAAHVPVFTVGVRDGAATAAGLRALASASPGQFVATTPAGLPAVMNEISATMDRGYVVRYRSRQPAGHAVAVTAQAAGVPGTVQLSYQAPAGKPVAVVRRAPRAPVHPPLSPFAIAPTLSPVPSIASQGTGGPAAGEKSVSWWESIPIVSGLCGVLLVLAVALALHRPSKQAVRMRVGSFVPGAESATDVPGSHGPQSDLDTPRLFARSKRWTEFAQDVEISRSPHKPAYLVKRAAIIGVIVGALVALLSGTPALGLVPMILWPFPLRMLVARSARKRRALFVDTLPGYLQDLASAMRVGRSFTSALAVVAANADEPVRSELERAVTDEALGRPLETSLESVAKRMQAPDVDQVALVAALNRRSGSNVAEALDRVADGARDRADMRREVKALTGQAKMSSSVLTGLPPILLVMISIISPQYAHPLFHTTIGIGLLVLCTGMVFAGWKVMNKITTIKA